MRRCDLAWHRPHIGKRIVRYNPGLSRHRCDQRVKMKISFLTRVGMSISKHTMSSTSRIFVVSLTIKLSLNSNRHSRSAVSRGFVLFLVVFAFQVSTDVALEQACFF